jgi:hypothetical protein
MPKFSDLAIFTKPVPQAPAAPAQLKAHCQHFGDDEVDVDLYESKWLQALESRGETVSADDFIEMSSTAVEDAEAEDALLSVMLADTSPPDGLPQDASEGDAGLYKIRYRYGPIRNSADSRELCKYLERKAQEVVVYRK